MEKITLKKQIKCSGVKSCFYVAKLKQNRESYQFGLICKMFDKLQFAQRIEVYSLRLNWVWIKNLIKCIPYTSYKE